MIGTLWNLLVRAAGTAVALWVVVNVVGGVGVVTPASPLIGDGSNDRVIVYLLSGLVIVLLNMTVRPVLHLIGLPVSILTLGLFALVINAVVFLLAATVTESLGMGLTVQTFAAAFWGAILMAVMNWFIGPLVGLLQTRR
ncbi:phage holin family protein [uncultured Corynebacterium sp.]|uniref:phage holin family protein n=1 Tax=uncultured Corynebacterium sp. TaxID=159447 RepID=UPI0025D2C616|nr:phage holin family protein [uncultured Corynebacterium sp.]